MWNIHFWSDSWFQKFQNEDANPEDQKGRKRPSTIDDQHLKTPVKQNPRQSVKEMSQVMDVSILTISDQLKKIGEVKKLY